MKTIIKATAAFLFACTGVIAQTGSIKGVVKNESGETLPNAVIRIEGESKGVIADIDGNFVIKPLDPGIYNIKVSSVGSKSILMKGVSVKSDQSTDLTFTLRQDLPGDSGEVVITYSKPKIDKTYTTFTSIDPEILDKGAFEPGNMTQMITGICSSCNTDVSGNLVMRGARPTSVQYLVDGEKMFGNTEVPSLAIQDLTLIHGGIPAEYGDVTGGIVVINTKTYQTGVRSKLNRQEEYQKGKEEEKAAKEKEELKKKGIEVIELK